MTFPARVSLRKFLGGSARRVETAGTTGDPTITHTALRARGARVVASAVFVQPERRRPTIQNERLERGTRRAKVTLTLPTDARRKEKPRFGAAFRVRV